MRRRETHGAGDDEPFEILESEMRTETRGPETRPMKRRGAATSTDPSWRTAPAPTTTRNMPATPTAKTPSERGGTLTALPSAPTRARGRSTRPGAGLSLCIRPRRTRSAPPRPPTSRSRRSRPGLVTSPSMPTDFAICFGLSLAASEASPRTETRKKETKREGEQKEPVAQGACENPAADVGVPLDRLERGVEQSRALARRFDSTSHRTPTFEPVREPLEQVRFGGGRSSGSRSSRRSGETIPSSLQPSHKASGDRVGKAVTKGEAE